MTNLKDGTGNPWAGHNKFNSFFCSDDAWTMSEVGNLGLVLPTGSRKKATKWKSVIMLIHHLNEGTGNPWAGQRSVKLLDAATKLLTMSKSGNFGLVLPTGSDKREQKFALLHFLTDRQERETPVPGTSSWNLFLTRLWSELCPRSGVLALCCRRVLLEYLRSTEIRPKQFKVGSYRKDGTGNPCAGHSKVKLSFSRLKNPTLLTIVGNLGFVLPTGSVEDK